MSRRPLDKEINRARRRAENARAVAAAEEAALNALLKAQAELFEAVAEEHRVLDLHTETEQSTVKHMDAAISQKRIGRPVTSEHPAAAKAVKLYGSIKAAARSISVHPSTFRSWYADGEEGRPIPESKVELLARSPWNIPKSAWKRRG